MGPLTSHIAFGRKLQTALNATLIFRLAENTRKFPISKSKNWKPDAIFPILPLEQRGPQRVLHPHCS